MDSQTLKRLVVWKSWWKWYQLQVEYKSNIPKSILHEWRRDSLYDAMISYLQLVNPKLVSSTTFMQLSEITLSSIYAVHLYETPWTFLKFYPFPEDAFPLLTQFINEFEKQSQTGFGGTTTYSQEFDTWILPFINTFQREVEAEYNLQVANQLTFNSKSSNIMEQYNMFPKDIEQNSQRLFYLFNLILLTNKLSIDRCWSETLGHQNLFLEKSASMKQFEVAKRIYTSVLTTTIAPTPTNNSIFANSPRPALVNPVIVPSPTINQIESDNKISQQILEAKKTAETLIENSKYSHKRKNSGVSATLMLNPQNMTVGIGVVETTKKEKKPPSHKLSKSSIERQYSVSEGSSSSSSSNKELKRKPHKKRLSWFKSDPSLITLSENAFMVQEPSSTPVLPIEEKLQFSCKNMLDVYYLMNRLISSFCDYMQVKSSPPSSPPDFLISYADSKQEDLQISLNKIISAFLWGSETSTESQMAFCRIELLDVIQKVIVKFYGSQLALNIENNIQMLLNRKYINYNRFKQIPDQVKTDANDIGIFLQFIIQYRLEISQFQASSLSQDVIEAQNTTLNNLFEWSIKQMDTLVRIRVEQFIQEPSLISTTPRTANLESPSIAPLGRTTLSPRVRSVSMSTVQGWIRAQVSPLSAEVIEKETPPRTPKANFKISNEESDDSDTQPKSDSESTSVK